MLPRPLFTSALPNIVLHALRKCGYNNFDDLIKESGEFKETVVEILQRVNFQPSELSKLVAPPLVDTAGQLLQNEALVTHIPTFSQRMDHILDGGVSSGTILQVCGGPGSAKTQLLLQLCVSIQLPETFGGLEASSIFIDADFGFCFTRLEEIAEGAVGHCRKIAKQHQMLDEVEGFNVKNICDNVHYVTVTSCIELIAAIQQVHRFILEHPKVKLVVIDSIIFPVLAIGDSLERTRLLYMIVNKLSQISEFFNVAVVFSNHLTTKIGSNTKQYIPALGEAFAHRIPQTLLLAKARHHFTAVLTHSSSAPPIVVNFQVTKEGIRDTLENEEASCSNSS